MQEEAGIEDGWTFENCITMMQLGKWAGSFEDKQKDRCMNRASFSQ